MNKQDYLALVKEQENKLSSINFKYRNLNPDHYQYRRDKNYKEIQILIDLYSNLYRKNIPAPQYPFEFIEDNIVNEFDEKIENEGLYCLDDILTSNGIAGNLDLKSSNISFRFVHDKGYDGDDCRYSLNFAISKLIPNDSFGEELEEFKKEFNIWNNLTYPKFLEELSDVVSGIEKAIGALKQKDMDETLKKRLYEKENELKSIGLTFSSINKIENDLKLSEDEKKISKEKRRLVLKQVIETMQAELDLNEK